MSKPKVISVSNQKGSVGKSTTVYNLVAGFAMNKDDKTLDNGRPFQKWPGRKSCVKADKRQSKEREQIEGQPVLGTGRLNLAYPPVFRDGRRYARAA